MPSAHKLPLLVVGAGPVGLALARALRQSGQPYILIDAATDVGGNWLHGTPAHARIISSRRTTAYTDFKMAQHHGDFPDRDAMLRYLQEFSRVHGMGTALQPDTKLLALRSQIPSDGNTVYTARTNMGELEARGVYLCTGHHWARRYPSWAAHYTGESLHSKNYKEHAQLYGRARVLVVGSGNSAADIACDAAREGAHVDMCVRGGRWLLPKTIGGKPTVERMNSMAPEALQKRALRTHMRQAHGAFAYLGGKPDHDIFDKHVTLSDELGPLLRARRVQVRGEVLRASGEEIHYQDGTVATYDLVVYATGYDLRFPFLPRGTVPTEGQHAQLYGGAMTRAHKQLYVVGASQPRYGFGPLIAPAAALLARYGTWQGQLHRPLGELYAQLGLKPAKSPFSNPRKAVRDIRLAGMCLPLLKAADMWLLRMQGPFVPVPLSTPAPLEQAS